MHDLTKLGLGPSKEKIPSLAQSKKKKPSLRIHPINLQGWKYQSQEELLRLHGVTTWDLLLLTETHSRRRRNCKKNFDETRLKEMFPECTCFEIACPCETRNRWSGFHGVAVIARPGIKVEPDVIIDLATGKIDHRQMAVAVISTDTEGNEMKTLLVICHYKSGSGKGPQLERLVQMYSTVEYMKGKTGFDVKIVAGDWNIAPSRSSFGIARKIFGDADLFIESFLQLEGKRKKGDPRIYTHEFRGRPGYFIDHSAIHCREGYYSEIALMKKEDHHITTDHVNFLQIDIHRGQSVVQDNLNCLADNPLDCQVCGMNAVVRKVHHVFCPYATKEEVIKALISHRKNKKVQVRVNKIRQKVKEMKSLYAHANGYYTPSKNHRDLCGTCGLYYDYKYEKEHLWTHSHGKFTFCYACSTTFKNVASLANHKSKECMQIPVKCDLCDKTFGKAHVVRSHRFSHFKLKCDMCPRLFYLERDLDSHVRNHKLGMTFQCQLCKIHFKTKELQQAHKMFHHPNFKCEVCDKKFEDEELYKTHSLLHAKIFSQRKKLFHCYKCRKGFFLRFHLLQHIVLDHTDVAQKNYTCEDCGRPFARMRLFREHLLIHENEKKFKCVECSAEYNSYHSYYTHSLLHKSVRHSCSECQKTFSTVTNLNQHIKDFHSTNPKSDYRVSCEVCGLSMIKCNLKIHLLTHSNEKNFQCKDCEKRFKTPQSLRSHVIIHKERKGIDCNVCHKTLADKKSLKSHMATQHNKDEQSKFVEMTTCSVCQKQVRSRLYKKHMTTHITIRQHICEVCNKAFKDAYSCFRHLKSHGAEVFKCSECEKTCTCETALRKHMRIHTCLQKCNTCSKTFSEVRTLRRHEETHLVDKKYKCELCGKHYKTFACLHRHQGGVHGNKHYECEKCLKIYTLKESLKRHNCSAVETRLYI